MTLPKLTDLQTRVLGGIGADWIDLYQLHHDTRWGQRGCTRDFCQLVRVVKWLSSHGLIETEPRTDRVRRIGDAK